MPEPDVAEVGLELAHDAAQQRRLARAVETEHEQPLAAPDVERHVLEHDLVARTPWRDRRPRARCGPRAAGPAASPGSCARPSSPRPFPPPCARRAGRATWRYAPASRSGAASSRRACAGGGISDSCRPAILARRSSSAFRATRYCEYVPRYSISSPSSRCSTRVIALVEQREVVADDEQRTAERPQEGHQPVLGVDVEVVRRLVEQQEVAAREQDARRARRAGARRRTARRSGGRDDRMPSPSPAAMRRTSDFGRVAAVGAERVLGIARTRGRCAPTGRCRPGSRSSSSRCAASSRPRPDSTCASAVPSTPAPRGGGSCGQVADRLRAAARRRAPPAPHPRAPSASTSCRRRCGRPGRPCRRRAARTTRRRASTALRPRPRARAPAAWVQVTAAPAVRPDFARTRV